MEALEGWRPFIKLLLELKTTSKVDRFFDLFLTIEEKKLLASRFLVIKALLKGNLSQREIAKVHKLSISQITRGSNALKRIDPQIKHFLEEIL